jgi:hypothetical protein
VGPCRGPWLLHRVASGHPAQRPWRCWWPERGGPAPAAGPTSAPPGTRTRCAFGVCLRCALLRWPALALGAPVTTGGGAAATCVPSAASCGRTPLHTHRSSFQKKAHAAVRRSSPANVDVDSDVKGMHQVPSHAVAHGVLVRVPTAVRPPVSVVCRRLWRHCVTRLSPLAGVRLVRRTAGSAGARAWWYRACRRTPARSVPVLPDPLDRTHPRGRRLCGRVHASGRSPVAWPLSLLGDTTRQRH